jgi:hypothetical protein
MPSAAADPARDSERLRAANINPATGLATDYLNHYNEVAMMISALGSAPEMAGTVLDWRPLGYAAHFRLTGFRERELAVAAYETAPDEVKVRFFSARREVDLAIAEVQDLIEAQPKAAGLLASRAPQIFAAIARLGSVISGKAGPAPGSPLPGPKPAAESRFP